MSRKVINVVVGGGNDIKYYDATNFSVMLKNLAPTFCLLVKYQADNDIYIEKGYYQSSDFNCLALAINFDLMIRTKNTSNQLVDMSIRDFLIDGGIYDEFISNPEITEEQFYNTTE